VLGGAFLRGATRKVHPLPSSVRRSAPPVCLRDQCFRCLFGGHHARFCRDPIQCTTRLHFSHIAHLCHAMPHTEESTPLRYDAPLPLQTVSVAYVPPMSAPTNKDSTTDVSCRISLWRRLCCFALSFRNALFVFKVFCSEWRTLWKNCRSSLYYLSLRLVPSNVWTCVLHVSRSSP
jgi:hypothetical protein